MKNLTIDKLIKKRRKLWEERGSIAYDAEYRESVAQYIVYENGGKLWQDLQANRFKFIELFMVVVDKKMQVVPFFLNDVQREFADIILEAEREYTLAKRNHKKFLILKGRQQGFTTLVNAINLADSILNQNYAGYILANSGENTTNIFFDKVKFPYEQLPETMKPLEKFSNRQELVFQGEGSTGLNSKIRVKTASDTDAGRSKTLNFLHISEGAMVDDLKGLLVGLGEALTKDTLALIESTANGFNDFKELWDNENNWECLFFEWWKTKEYSLRFTSEQLRKDFIISIENAPEKTDKTADTEQWVYSRCKWLKNEVGLDLNQIYWYFDKWKDKRETIKQEYPCTPREAFLASGRPYFHMENLDRRHTELKILQPIVRKGYYEYDYIYDAELEKKLIDDSSIRFIDNPRGQVEIFFEPETLKGYSIGGDTASEGEDKNFAQCVDSTGKQMATIKVESDEDLFADQCYCLGMEYNEAMIALEVNHSTHPTKVLAEREYPNLFLRENSPDSVATTVTPNYGFRTTGANRFHILGLVREIVRDKIAKLYSIYTIEEMMAFVINDKGKPESDGSKHDDSIMAYAIALYVTEQQLSEGSPPLDKLQGIYFESELRDMGYSDWEIEQYLKGEDLYVR